MASSTEGIRRCKKCGAPLGEDAAFCEECGSPVEKVAANPVCAVCNASLEEGAAFCSECGAPVGGADAGSTDGVDRFDNAPRRTLLINVPGSSESSAEAGGESAGEGEGLVGAAAAKDSIAAVLQSPKGRLIALAAIALVVVAVVICVVVFSQGAPETAEPAPAQSAPAVQEEQSEEPAPALEEDAAPEPVVEAAARFDTLGVHYDNTATTAESGMPGPAFAISYPSTWSVANNLDPNEVAAGCIIPLVNDPDHDSSKSTLSIQVGCIADGPLLGFSYRAVSVSKLSDSQFVPGGVGDRDYSALGSFMVAEVDSVIETGSMKGCEAHYVAVVPESYLDVNNVVVDGYGVPGFDYSCFVMAYCETPSSDDELEEVVDILSTFRVATESDLGPSTSQAAESSDYIIADSDTRTLDRAELEAMDLHDLFLARNEIYARHGRGFINDELKEYFGSKSWYDYKYSPEEFDAMPEPLNATEKANAELMIEIERSRNSPYLS